MKKWLRDLIINFMIGGIVTSSVSYVGTFLSPVLGAILWSFPVSILPTLYYMSMEGRNNKYLGDFVLTTTFALVILFMTLFSLGYFYRQPKINFWLPIIKSIGVFVVTGIIYFAIIKYFNLEKYF